MNKESDSQSIITATSGATVFPRRMPPEGQEQVDWEQPPLRKGVEDKSGFLLDDPSKLCIYRQEGPLCLPGDLVQQFNPLQYGKVCGRVAVYGWHFLRDGKIRPTLHERAVDWSELGITVPIPKLPPPFIPIGETAKLPFGLSAADVETEMLKCLPGTQALLGMHTSQSNAIEHVVNVSHSPSRGGVIVVDFGRGISYPTRFLDDSKCHFSLSRRASGRQLGVLEEPPSYCTWYGYNRLSSEWYLPSIDFQSWVSVPHLQSAPALPSQQLPPHQQQGDWIYYNTRTKDFSLAYKMKPEDLDHLQDNPFVLHIRSHQYATSIISGEVPSLLELQRDSGERKNKIEDWQEEVKTIADASHIDGRAKLVSHNERRDDDFQENVHEGNKIVLAGWLDDFSRRPNYAGNLYDRKKVARCKEIACEMLKRLGATALDEEGCDLLSLGVAGRKKEVKLVADELVKFAKNLDKTLNHRENIEAYNALIDYIPHVRSKAGKSYVEATQKRLRYTAGEIFKQLGDQPLRGKTYEELMQLDVACRPNLKENMMKFLASYSSQVLKVPELGVPVQKRSLPPAQSDVLPSSKRQQISFTAFVSSPVQAPLQDGYPVAYDHHAAFMPAPHMSLDPRLARPPIPLFLSRPESNEQHWQQTFGSPSMPSSVLQGVQMKSAAVSKPPDWHVRENGKVLQYSGGGAGDINISIQALHEGGYFSEDPQESVEMPAGRLTREFRKASLSLGSWDSQDAHFPAFYEGREQLYSRATAEAIGIRKSMLDKILEDHSRQAPKAIAHSSRAVPQESMSR